MIKKLFLSISILSTFFIFSSCSSDVKSTKTTFVPSNSQSNEKTELTETEKDAYILYDYSYNDAKKSNNKTIIEEQIENGKKYSLNEHVLSCGTHMNGFINEIVQNGKTNITASFKISNNTYKIENLDVNITKTNDKLEGYLNIDGKKIDINRFPK